MVTYCNEMTIVREYNNYFSNFRGAKENKVGS